MNLKMKFILIMSVFILGGCSSQPAFEVRKPSDTILSCLRLGSELAIANAYLNEMSKKAGVTGVLQKGAGDARTILSGASSFIPIPIIGPIITTVLSLFRSNISPQKALQSARLAEERIRHIKSLNKIKNCKKSN